LGLEALPLPFAIAARSSSTNGEKRWFDLIRRCTSDALASAMVSCAGAPPAATAATRQSEVGALEPLKHKILCSLQMKASM
jgi:hypothetical protein